MYEIITEKRNPIIFDNSEVFIAITHIAPGEKIMHWSLPGQIKEKFDESFSIEVGNPEEEKVIQKYRSWFSEELEIEDALRIEVSYYYRPERQIDSWDDNVFLSDQYETPYQGILEDVFCDKNQLSAAYFIDDQIVSIAFDNGNGAVTILTREKHRNKGYATQCLCRLLSEYKKRGKTLGFGTRKSERAAHRVAEKAGMVKEDYYGYWVVIPAEYLKKHPEKIEEFLQ